MPSSDSKDIFIAFKPRPQTTLDEWTAAGNGQTVLPTDEQGMKDELVHLQKKLDYTCLRDVGVGRFAVTETYLGGYGEVERCLVAAAGRAGVRLVKRVG